MKNAALYICYFYYLFGLLHILYLNIKQFFVSVR